MIKTAKADTVKLPKKDTTKSPKKDTVKLPKKTTKSPQKNTVEPPKENIEEKVQSIKEKLSELFASEDVDLATVIFTIKQNGEPNVWRKGHFYDTATLLNKVLFAYKSKAVTELGL